MAQDKKTLQRNIDEVSRNFNYTKGNVRLNFTLRIDIKQELKDFKECLEQALKDVNEELNSKK